MADDKKNLGNEPNESKESNHNLIPDSPRSVDSVNAIFPMGQPKAVREMHLSRRISNQMINNKNADIHVNALIDVKNVNFLTNAITAKMPILDFRMLEDRVQNRSDSTDDFQFVGINSASNSPNDGIFTPPNEHNWYCKEEMGNVLRVSDVCKLFTIIPTLHCGSYLQGLIIHAKQDSSTVYDISDVTDKLGKLKALQRLTLSGFCDDVTLKVVGNSLPLIQHLDVSFSKLVTDLGIRQLFYQEDAQVNPTMYLVSTWVNKNTSKMNPIASTITYLNYSWTSVTSIGRTMVQLLNGSYLFKRLDNETLGHHIFIRESVAFKDFIPAEIEDANYECFEERLTSCIGTKGAKSFLKLIECHPWRNCALTLYSPENDKNSNSSTAGSGLDEKHSYGMITPNLSENRIQGIIRWYNGILVDLYSIYPVNINTLGTVCQLRLFRGILNDTWRMQCSLLPHLAQLDIFTDSTTLINILQSCPNLCKVKTRIRDSPLVDEQVIKAMQNSMCRRMLGEFWVASYTDLVQLSLKSVDALINACPKLRRLGDLSVWKLVDADKLYVFCESLKNTQLAITWAGMNLPANDTASCTLDETS